MTIAWIQTYTGKAFNPLAPHPADICIVDISHSLSMLCRFNGHTRRFYSVAEHCTHVSRLVPADLALAGLLHDAAEAYVSDIPTPMKRLTEIVWQEGGPGELRALKASALERRILRVVFPCFGLSPRLEESEMDINRADLAMLMAEKAQLLGPEPASWCIDSPPADVKVECWPPELAERRFLSRFHELTAGRWEREAA